MQERREMHFDERFVCEWQRFQESGDVEVGSAGVSAERVEEVRPYVEWKRWVVSCFLFLFSFSWRRYE